MHQDRFVARHIGPDRTETRHMLDAIGVESLDQLIAETVPAQIRRNGLPSIPDAVSEDRYLREVRKIADQNRVFRSFIGLGYYGTLTPGVVLRNIFENPGWYTQYTPYQAEIAQGRLEALLNFQTMVSDLTAMPIANASLLDEATAAAEAMTMCHGLKNKKAGDDANRFWVSKNTFPQTIDVLLTRAEPLGIEVVVADPGEFRLDEKSFGILLQVPGEDGSVEDLRALVEGAKAQDQFVVVAADLLSLALVTPPGEWGADVVVGNTQRFGVPMGFGGPHAAFFATREEYVRNIPGRLIGISVDRFDRPALRMALQTREQHIRRDKATSNICTAQALLAIMAGMYAVYHGPEGIKGIAQRLHRHAQRLSAAVEKMGFQRVNAHFFDTLRFDVGSAAAREAVRTAALAKEINFHYPGDRWVQLSLDETVLPEDLADMAACFAAAAGTGAPGPDHFVLDEAAPSLPERLVRTSAFLAHPVFNAHHSESQMLRYIKRLEAKDLSLAHAMIPLGSCTMKLNATSEMVPVSWPAFANMHPFVPADQAQGYHRIFSELEQLLSELTGFKACSLQPNSGAQGEYAGLLTIRAYHLDKGNAHRNVALIPSSAHGTNPASAVMAGMKVVVVKCDEQGNIDVDDLRARADEHRDNLSCLMVTYPSTHGVFESRIKEICGIVHERGGLVYMDGANMNAQVGLTSPGHIDADVCHLNLHKTFAIPHGGGGPGMGPICVNEKLAPYLSGHPLVRTGGSKATRAVSAAPWGSASILLISYGYIRMLGSQGVTDSTKFAILNANYIKARLEKAFSVLYTGEKGRVAHELIVDLREFKKAGIEAEDVAKRLMDYGFHAPTLSFPVAGTILIEPTESEDRDELDRLCEALLQIREEIDEIARGEADAKDNVLKNAPHPIHEVTADEWHHAYSREKAAYPLPFVRERKFWMGVGRVNNTHGDRNLVCTCLPVEAYS
jgi:glycine dehydrogenase